MARCGLCFQDKPRLEVVLPRSAAICRACFHEVDRVLGWLQHEGYGVQLGLDSANEVVDTRTGELLHPSYDPGPGAYRGTPSPGRDNPPDPPFDADDAYDHPIGSDLAPQNLVGGSDESGMPATPSRPRKSRPRPS